MSNQAVATPLEFIMAVEARFGPISFDLAANAGNSVMRAKGDPLRPRHFGPGADETDALAGDLAWPTTGLNWCNPPFDNIAKFTEKAAAQRLLGARTALIGPAAVCTGWFVQHVSPNAYVFELTPRVFKVNIRDCILALFEPAGYLGRETWKWKTAERSKHGTKKRDGKGKG